MTNELDERYEYLLYSKSSTQPHIYCTIAARTIPAVGTATDVPRLLRMTRTLSAAVTLAEQIRSR